MSAQVDLMERAKAAIDADPSTPEAYLRPLPDGAEGISLRQAPPTVVELYMDGTQEVDFIIDVYARYEREDRALDMADAAVVALVKDGLESANGSYSVNFVSIYSGPRDVGQPQDPMHTVVAGVRVSAAIDN